MKLGQFTFKRRDVGIGNAFAAPKTRPDFCAKVHIMNTA